MEITLNIRLKLPVKMQFNRANTKLVLGGMKSGFIRSLRIKPTIFLFLVCCQVSLAQTGKPGIPENKKQIRSAAELLFEKKKLLISLLKKQESDWNRADLTAFLQPYWDSDTLVTVNLRGLKYGKSSLERQLRKDFPDSSSMGHLDYEVIHISLIGEKDAFLTGKWLRKNEKKFRGGYFTILLRKTGSRWVIISEHMG